VAKYKPEYFVLSFYKKVQLISVWDEFNNKS